MAKKRAGIGCLTVFLSIFVVTFGGFGVYGTYQQIRVRSFLPVEGVVTHSEVGVNRDSDGDTYYPDIRFRYEVDGRAYDSGKYRIQRVSSSGRSGKQKIVRQYPVGAKIQGWYDPDDPGTAVVDKSFSFFPIIFLVIGIVVLGIIVGMWVHHFRSPAAEGLGIGTRGGLMTHKGLAGGARMQDVALQRYGGPAGQVSSFAGMIVFCLLWNAISYGIATALWFLNPDDVPFFAKAILVLFMGIGLVLVGAVIKMALARMKLFAPELHVSAHPLRLGEAFELRFQQRVKSPVHVEKVSVKFVCRESATYQRGTDTTTVTHDVFTEEREFAHDTAADSAHPLEETLSLAIPEDGMHSFQANRNRVNWLLEVRTAVADWPDYSDTFELQVAPERAPAGEAS